MYNWAMDQLTVFIPIETVPKSYQRMRKGIGLTDKCRAYQTDATRFLKKFAPKSPLDGNLKITLTFYIRRLESHKNLKFPTIKPDLDNLCKSALDCIQNADIIANDSRVTELSLRKVFAGGECSNGVIQPGCLVEIQPVA